MCHTKSNSYFSEWDYRQYKGVRPQTPKSNPIPVPNV